MKPPKFKHYLLLLNRPSVESSATAVKLAKELGVIVTTKYGNQAIEVMAPAEKVEMLFKQGLFHSMQKGAVSKSSLDKYTPEQKKIINLWNDRHSKKYIELKKDITNYGKPWEGKNLYPPKPYSRIDTEKLKKLLDPYLKKEWRRIKTNKELLRRFDELFEKNIKTKEFAYHLKNLKYHLDPSYIYALLTIPWAIIIKILEAIEEDTEDVCWKMSGEVSVGLVFVESSLKDGPKFSDSERNDICNEIIDGLNYLTDEHPTNNLTWVLDFQFCKINTPDNQTVNENGPSDGIEAHWRNPAMQLVNYNGNTYSGNMTGVSDYREDMRTHNRSAHAFVIFITPYRNNWHAYAGSRRVTLAKHNNWGGWGRCTIDIITAHETSHLFGAADEYTGSGTPCNDCDTQFGCDKIPNGNCGTCAHPHQGCIMAENQHKICHYTRGQIGWSDLFVELWTDADLWSGTNDDVWLDIGDKTYVLDTIGHDDRENGNREGYAIWDKDIEKANIKRILIRKSSDGFAGGWKLKRVRVFFRGEMICDKSPHVWLEDDHRWYVGCIFNTDIVNKLEVKITTADVSWAGTDDDVTLTLAGRSWNLDNPGSNDFERGDTNTFRLDPRTSFYVSDIHSIRISKSSDGIAGGWKLKGVKLIVNDIVVYNNQSINRWLEDNHRVWEGYI
ncbi:MAG TPA: PLAT/LH2 domain-containing protein [Chitinophagaceae bacterium]|nr:PLAT/LH2 domain-containing protein [Chitinophagaceae bacterium]